VLLDRRLFLPEKWFTKEYEERWQKCKIPDGTVFKKKPELARPKISAIRNIMRIYSKTYI